MRGQETLNTQEDEAPAVTLGRALIDEGGSHFALAEDSAGPCVLQILPAGPDGDRLVDIAARLEERHHLRIDHPNLVQYDGFSHQPFGRTFSWKTKQAETLSDYVERKGPLPLSDFAPICAQILKALGYLHDRELALGGARIDLILVSEPPDESLQVQLIDTRLRADARAISAIGDDESGSTDASREADIRSLTSVFATMLVGAEAAKRFCAAPSAERLEAEVLALDLEALPPGLSELVVRCAADDDAVRPGNANEVARALIEAVPRRMIVLRRPNTIPPSAPVAAAGGEAATLAPPETRSHSVADVPDVTDVTDTAESEDQASGPVYPGHDPFVEHNNSRAGRVVALALLSLAVAAGVLWWSAGSRADEPGSIKTDVASAANPGERPTNAPVTQRPANGEQPSSPPSEPTKAGTPVPTSQPDGSDEQRIISPAATQHASPGSEPNPAQGRPAKPRAAGRKAAQKRKKRRMDRPASEELQPPEPSPEPPKLEPAVPVRERPDVFLGESADASARDGLMPAD